MGVCVCVCVWVCVCVLEERKDMSYIVEGNKKRRAQTMNDSSNGTLVHALVPGCDHVRYYYGGG